MSCSPKRLNRVTGHIFVGEESHGSYFKGVNLLRLKGLTRIVEARSDVFLGEPGIVPPDIFFRPALRQEAHNELHRQPRPPDDRLTEQDFRVYDDAVFRSSGGR